MRCLRILVRSSQIKALVLISSYSGETHDKLAYHELSDDVFIPFSLQESTYTLKTKTKVDSQQEDDAKSANNSDPGQVYVDRDDGTSDSPPREDISTNTSIKNDNDSSTTVLLIMNLRLPFEIKPD